MIAKKEQQGFSLYTSLVFTVPRSFDLFNLRQRLPKSNFLLKVDILWEGRIKGTHRNHKRNSNWESFVSKDLSWYLLFSTGMFFVNQIGDYWKERITGQALMIEIITKSSVKLKILHPYPHT